MSLRALPPTVALVDETGKISHSDLVAVAGALGEQVATDFEPAYHVRANVVATQNPGPHQWTVRIRTHLDEPGALGYHTDDHNQPVSYVQAGEGWTVTASHELLEMLGDPWGNRMHGGRVPEGIDAVRQLKLKTAVSHVSYLLEACDPCEATSYEVAGVEVSDFLIPAAYYRSSAGAPRYSFAGGVQRPRQVAEGGYVSFCRPDGEWFQVTNFGGLRLHDIGRFDRAEFSSLREFSDHHARTIRASW